MSAHTQVPGAVLEVLPAVPGEVTGVLHVLAFVGVVYVFKLGGIRFSSRGVELFGRTGSPQEVAMTMVVLAIVVATSEWWAGVVFFLTGWQAFGVICLEMGWLLQSAASGIDLAAVTMAVVGLLLLVLPWAV